jgi:hypothetical protein
MTLGGKVPEGRRGIAAVRVAAPFVKYWMGRKPGGQWAVVSRSRLPSAKVTSGGFAPYYDHNDVAEAIDKAKAKPDSDSRRHTALEEVKAINSTSSCFTHFKALRNSRILFRSCPIRR